MTIFDLLITLGATLTLLGFIGLVWCILRVWRARRAQLPDDEMRAVLQKTLPLNLGALAVSVLGLMLVIIGIFLS
ncbi:MAG: hypothetical protein ABJM43_20455 [Paracoccaceae bacterium]